MKYPPRIYTTRNHHCLPSISTHHIHLSMNLLWTSSELSSLVFSTENSSKSPTSYQQHTTSCNCNWFKPSQISVRYCAFFFNENFDLTPSAPLKTEHADSKLLHSIVHQRLKCWFADDSFSVKPLDHHLLFALLSGSDNTLSPWVLLIIWIKPNIHLNLTTSIFPFFLSFQPLTPSTASIIVDWLQNQE